MSESNYSLTVYRASAGSGKTFTLAARYIALLLTDNAPRSILAVTFTHKATAEMKTRILQYLYSLADNPDGEGVSGFRSKVDEIVGFRLDSATVRRKARRALAEILTDYDRFAIVTIDSFLQHLLSEVARTAGLQTNYQVVLNDKDVTDMAIDSLLSHYRERSSLVSHRIERLIYDRIENDGRWDVRKQLSTAARNLRRDAYLRCRDDIAAYLKTDPGFAQFRQLLRSNSVRKPIVEMEQLLERYDSLFASNWTTKTNDKYIKDFVECVRNSLSGKADKKHLFNGLRSSARKYMVENPAYIKTYNGPASPETLREIIEAMDDLCPSCRHYIGNLTLCERFLHELGLLSSIADEVDAINRREGRMLLSMTSLVLQELIQSADDVSFVLERAGTRYSHVMIDEFQDTSSTQWRNFVPLIEEVLSRGGSTLLVGDVKQSIYRWRAGDWEILHNMGAVDASKPTGLERFFEGGRNKPINLQRNFRSDRNVVDFNLHLFKTSATMLDDLSQSFSERRIVEAIYDEGFDGSNLTDYYRASAGEGYVDVRAYPYKVPTKHSSAADEVSEEALAPAVIRRMLSDMFEEIVRLRDQKVPLNEMMILIRNNSEAEPIINYLNAHRDDTLRGITIDSADAYQLQSSLSVQMLVAAMRYVLNPTDTVALYYIVRHYRNDILGEDHDWGSVMKNLDQLMPAALKPYELRRLPLYELAERLATMLLYVDGRRQLGDDSYVMCFLDHVADFDASGVGGLEGFVERWDTELYRSAIPVPQSTNGIKLMTIHKSKGLESHTLFIPFCNWPGNEGFYKNNELLWCQPQTPPYNTVPALPVPVSRDLEESIFANDYNEEKVRCLIDNMNVLYVALTRAGSNLYVYVPLAQSKNGLLGKEGTFSNVGQMMVMALGKVSEFDAADPATDYVSLARKGNQPMGYKEKDEEVDRLHPVVTSIDVSLKAGAEHIMFRDDTRSAEFLAPLDGESDDVLQAKEYIRKGNLYHKLLSEIATPADADAAIEAMLSNGLVESRQQADEMSRLLERCWRNPKVAEWFDGSWTLFREATILTRDAQGQIQAPRPDRVMTKEGRAVVVDFKFAAPKAKHHTQVGDYMALLTHMGYTSVEGYVWYVYSNKIVQVKSNNAQSQPE